ncbi:hypothetical protein KAK07_02730 [Ideonella sp. 4Y16]|uniref:hypothetical protein n=1 Tax=Ideonella alba TaxID=2824118 RepID=UPI001B37B9DB|nr:hypothetical protein [Ideonella alba]MBQ0942245.1 hypothetical protein [Ideonella alba]
MTAQFTPLRILHLVSLLILMASVAFALNAYMIVFAAAGIALVLVGLLHVLLEGLAHAIMRRAYLEAAMFGAGALLVVSITAALTAANLDSTMFATPASKRQLTEIRGPMERELQRVIGQAETAHAAMLAWAEDAGRKAEIEKTKGGSCPNRVNTQGIEGPVTLWRKDDSQIAATLAKDLSALLDTARERTNELVALGKPSDFSGVKDVYEKANAAVDAAALLTAGGSYAPGALRTLESQRISNITYGGGQTVNCGDSGRLVLIERAHFALTALAAVQPPPRMQPAVDVSDRNDVVTRALLRSINTVASVLTFGQAGSFAGDQAMTHALKTNGVWNIETLPMTLAAIAETTLAISTLLLVRLGRPPFSDNVIDWLRAAREGGRPHGVVRRLLLTIATRLGNLFYVVPETSAPVAPSMASGGGRGARGRPGFEPLALPPEPDCRQREAGFAMELLPYHLAVTDRDFLIIPIDAQTQRVRNMAHVLRAQGVLQALNTSAARDLVRMHPEVGEWLDMVYPQDSLQRHQDQSGTWWSRLFKARPAQGDQRRFQVFQIEPTYAQFMRLRHLDQLTAFPAPARLGHVPAATSSADDVPAVHPTAGRHVSLRRLLAQRPGFGR